MGVEWGNVRMGGLTLPTFANLIGKNQFVKKKTCDLSVNQYTFLVIMSHSRATLPKKNGLSMPLKDTSYGLLPPDDALGLAGVFSFFFSFFPEDGGFSSFSLG